MKTAMEQSEKQILGGVQQSLLKYGRFQGSLDQLVASHQQAQTREKELNESRIRYSTASHSTSFIVRLMHFLENSVFGPFANTRQQNNEIEALTAQSLRLEARAQKTAQDLHQV